MKKALLVVVVILVFIFTMYGCQNKNLVGSISIISSEKEYLPESNWINSLEDGLAGDGMRKAPNEVSAGLDEIPLTGDLEIIIDGKTTGNPAYTLFNEDYEEVYYRNHEFKEPSEPGVYILLIELVWGNKTRYEGFQYFFKLIKK
jgi:hypothetical protein